MADAAILPVRTPVFCGATRRRTDDIECRRPAGWGTSHPGVGRCKLHGGATPTHVNASQIATAREHAVLYGVPRQVHPLDGLMEEYWRTAGLVDVYEAMCVALLPRDVVWGVQSVEESAPDGSDGGESMTPAERKIKSGVGVNLWVKLFNEERERFAKLGEAILRLDIDSRKVEYTASQVAALVAVLLSPDLGLSEDQRRVAARLLRGIETAKAIEGQAVTT